MSFLARLVCCLVFLSLLGSGAVAAQENSDAGSDTTRSWHDDAWTHIVTRQEVSFAYIFYREADNEHNGVVLRLRNRNPFPMRYDFTVVFRSPDAERSAHVTGQIAADTIKTGDESGLFWVPFRDQQRIAEVGLRGIDLTPLRSSDAPSRR